VKRALVNRCFAEETDGDLVRVLVLRSEGEAGGQRNLSTDDGVTAEKAEFLIEHVHRAAFAFRATGGFAEKLGHDGSGRHALGERLAVFAVTAEHVVVLAKRGDRADGDCFLSDVEMAEAADLSGDVDLGCFLFETPDQEHLAVTVR
jgi:hypothetical protein